MKKEISLTDSFGCCWASREGEKDAVYINTYGLTPNCRVKLDTQARWKLAWFLIRPNITLPKWGRRG